MAGVLVTGAAGFLGSAVCRRAVAEGARVVGLVRAGELTQPVAGVEYREIDWLDASGVRSALAGVAPERIVHCAGVTPRALVSTSALYDANVGLVWRLLAHIASEVPAAGVVIVSSAAVYGSSPNTPTSEEEPLNPLSHYASSKVMAEQAARAFVQTDGVRVSIARPFNLLGVGEPRGSVVSDVIEQLDAGASVIRVREIVSARDFVDVEDAAKALLLLAERGEPRQAYNVCSGKSVTVATLVDEILRAWDSPAVVEVADSLESGTVSRGDNRRMRELGWSPESSLAASVGRLRSR